MLLQQPSGNGYLISKSKGRSKASAQKKVSVVRWHQNRTQINAVHFCTFILYLSFSLKHKHAHTQSWKVRSKIKWSPEARLRKGENVLVMIFCVHAYGASWCISFKTFLLNVHSKLRNCRVQHLLACLQVVLWLFINS